MTLAFSSLAEAADPAPQSSAQPSPGDDAEAQFQRARAALREPGGPRDPAAVFTLMEQAAARGHAEAEAGLGYLFSAGIGTKQDDVQAANWFRKAAEKGVAKAQFNLGRLLLAGRGVAQSEADGMHWLRRAAAQDFTEALVAVGEAFYFGDHGQPQDYAQAFPLLLKAAQAGHANAQNAAGLMLRDGRGVKMNWPEAEVWFRRAAAQGHVKAQSNLGLFLARQPKSGPENIEALKWLMVADARGEVTATKALDELLPKMPEGDVVEARKQTSEVLAKSQSVKAGRPD